MKAFLFFFICFALAVSTGCRTSSGKNIRMTENGVFFSHVLQDNDAGFRLEMPSAPEIEHERFETSHGVLKTVTYTSEHANTVYMMTYSSFPEESLTYKHPTRQLDSARDGSLLNTGGELLDQKQIDFNNMPGIEFSVRVNGGSYRTRIYITKSTIFQILVAAEGVNEIMSEKSEKYFNSFRLIGGASP